jgi:hypothetical protein
MCMPCHPFDTDYSPLKYSSNPGVTVSRREGSVCMHTPRSHPLLVLLGRQLLLGAVRLPPVPRCS